MSYLHIVPFHQSSAKHNRACLFTFSFELSITYHMILFLLPPTSLFSRSDHTLGEQYEKICSKAIFFSSTSTNSLIQSTLPPLFSKATSSESPYVEVGHCQVHMTLAQAQLAHQESAKKNKLKHPQSLVNSQK